MLSAEQFLPAAKSLDAHHKSLEMQAMWITRQNDTNRTHWEKICENSKECQDCRADRRLVEAMLVQRLDRLQTTIDKMSGGAFWITSAGRFLLAVAGLLIAAKAAGVIR